MTPTAIAILSFSMSADAFAASIGRGVAHRPSVPMALRHGLVFGVIEAMTPLLGWTLGMVAAGFVEAIDHWIAFGLLVLVGGRMLREALARDEAGPDGERPPQDVVQKTGRAGALALVATAVGTSIDAAAVGVSLAFLEVNILVIALCIGAATFAMSTIGMLVGRVVGARLGRIAEIVGGIALIGLGTKILLEHLGVLAGG